MHRVILFAKNRNCQDKMSLFRNLFCQCRYILRQHILGRFGKNQPILNIEKHIKVELSGASPSSRISSNIGKGPLEWIGSQVHSQVRRVFVENVLRRVSSSSEDMRRRAIKRLIYGNDSRPFLALVGVSLAGTGTMLTRADEYEGICSEIREALAEKQNINQNNSNQNIENVNDINVNSLKFGPLISQGCNGAVYKAEWMDNDSNNKSESEERDTEKQWPLAIKMLYNYDVESNASAIYKAMHREIVPAVNLHLTALEELDRGFFGNIKRCPPHPNIVLIYDVFADQIPMLESSITNYPMALPQRLYQNGMGRNMSLFLVMKRYDCNLHEFLQRRSQDLPLKSRILLLTQLLEAIAHLNRNGIAHRDLKSDNILLELPEDENYPHLVLTDFGCCLADNKNNLNLPFRSPDTDLGGNRALLAPEIINANHGAFKWISYSKSDIWSAGAIAYEIFGSLNPFYKMQNRNVLRLDSSSYLDKDLPELPREVPPIMRRLVKSLLKKNPNERMGTEMAVAVCHIYLWAPSIFLIKSGDQSSSFKDGSKITEWLISLTTKILCYRNVPHMMNAELEFLMIHSFLKRLRFDTIKRSIDWIQLGN